jgi:hypothetical protein
MNWYKKAQQDIHQQYQQIFTQAPQIQLIGSGLNEMISIPGSTKAIIARELLERVKSRIMPLLIKNNVRVIDTSPVPIANAQGLNISSEPGIIHIDTKKIFENAKKALPPTSQFDGANIDPDVINGLVDKMANWIEAEFTETVSHESEHEVSYWEALQKGQPFTSIQESPAEQYGRKIRQQYFPNK